MGAVLPTKIHGEKGLIMGPFQLKAADSVDGLLYMPDASNVGECIVAAGNVLCGWMERRAKIDEYVSLIITGVGPVKCSGVVAAYSPVTPDSAGKVKAGTPGTDHIIGFSLSVASGADGDIITIVKVA